MEGLLDGNVTSVTAVIVDDHALFRQGLRELLEEHGIEVVGEGSDGEEALTLIEDRLPNVALMDLNMPRMSGIDATRSLRERCPSTRVVMLTVSPADEDVAEAILAGASGYLLKDAPTDEIVAGVNAAARGEALLSSRIAARLLGRLRGVDGTASRPVLTDREREVLKLIAAGKDNNQIAAELVLSPQTVKNHVSNLLAKLQVENRVQAAVQAVRRGLV